MSVLMPDDIQLTALLPPASECFYTACYCEENVWQLCSSVVRRHPAAVLSQCHVIFVSNEDRVIPMWRQRAGRGDQGKLVIWDYHVIFLYRLDSRSFIFDLDSELPFPTPFYNYATETFHSDDELKSKYFRYFRVVPADTFLKHFSSDRSHMKAPDGTWIKEPPEWPPIQTQECSNNLEQFINMNPKQGLGEVFNLTEFLNKFH